MSPHLKAIFFPFKCEFREPLLGEANWADFLIREIRPICVSCIIENHVCAKNGIWRLGAIA